MDYMQRYRFWCDAGLPESVRQELTKLEDQTEELKSRFGSDLQFGTAGLRGIMGIGSNRLNVYTVRRAAQGMASWLSSSDLPQIAAIGYDSRHQSREFAQVCAVAFAEAGIVAYLYDRLAPTPMLSFAVRELGCGCGIVISASHNSGEYNGVKCYGSDGCQLTDEPAGIVTGIISGIPYFEPEKKSFDQFMQDGLIRYIGEDLWQKYYQTVMTQSVYPDAVRNAGLRVVYTPLCGTGNEPVREILGRMGVDVQIVACQEKPDGDFKTCEYPNPETDAALTESYKTADKYGCDVIIGTDPDCDRVTIAVPDGGKYRKLSGNELGCLLMDYILKAGKERNTIAEDAIVVRSIVSTPLADRIAEKYGVKMCAVLTGFKYIGGEILKLEQQGREDRFLFGFEESCGYLKGTYARDKDAVVASMLVCEMAAYLKLNGMTILDALEGLYKEYGSYVSHINSVELKGADAMEKAAAIMKNLRSDPPARIAGLKVTTVCDYQSGVVKDTGSGAEHDTGLPRSNVLEYILGENGSVIVRPSGTEPKVKYYFTAVGNDRPQAEDQLKQMQDYFS